MTRKITNPTLFQAVVLGDHKRIAELVAVGQHPLIHIERCIEIRGDAVETLMAHVSHDSISVEVVKRVIAHLEFIERYPVALQVLKEWLEAASFGTPIVAPKLLQAGKR